MSPIKGLSETRRLPRLGKIHLGVKATNDKGVEYPRATDYFVCPEEVQALYGNEPRELDILIPVEDDEVWANQYYRRYSRTRGLVCKGDGETCRRMIDTATGDTADHNTKSTAWVEGLPCEGKNCPDYQGNKCKEVINLQFLLPRVPGLGVWQIDSGSINSIININSCATMIRAVCGRISWIPISLTLEPTEVVSPDDGKRKVVHCLHLRHKSGLLDLISASEKPRAELIVATPLEDEAPLDNADGLYESHGEIDDVVEELWGTQEGAPPTKAIAKTDNKPSIQSPIDTDWLREQLDYLQKKGLKEWFNPRVVTYLKSITGREASSVTQAVSYLNPKQAASFVEEVKNAVG